MDDDIGFYGILTRPRVGYVRLAQILVDCGVRVIQLRMKEGSPDERRQVALAVRRVIPSGVTYIVNDDPRLTLEAGADGVHLGQGDLPYAEARALLGPDAVIGLSTHAPEQTRAACLTGCDYIGIGPVWPTPTKTVADPAIGLDGMAAMLALATIPAVVLGSIDLTNVRQVLARGARNICAVRLVNDAEDPAPVLCQMLDIIASAKEAA